MSSSSSAVRTLVCSLALSWACAGLEARAQQQDPQKPDSEPAAAMSAKEIRTKLRARRDFHFENVPLKVFVADLEQEYGVKIRLDGEGLGIAGIADDAPVTADLENTSVSAALRKVLKEKNLRYVIRDGEVVVTSAPPQPPREVQPAPAPMIWQQLDVALPQGAPVIPAEQEAQYVQNFRPLLVAELNYLKRVCHPADEQLRRLNRDGEEILRKVAREFAKRQQGFINFQQQGFINFQQQGFINFQVNGQATPFADPRETIRKQLVDSAKSRLSAEQAGRYAKELELRAAQRKRMGVLNVVARIDNHLFLSAAQRDALSEALSAQWDDAWGQSAGMVVENDPSLPQIPDQLVVPHLTDAQRRLWQSTPKNNNVVFINVNQQGGDVRVFNGAVLNVWQADDVMIDAIPAVPAPAEPAPVKESPAEKAEEQVP